MSAGERAIRYSRRVLRRNSARPYTGPVGGWYWIGVCVGLGVGIGVLLAGVAGAARARIAAVILAAVAWIPAIGYVEAAVVPALAGRLRRRAPERYAGLRSLARD